MIQDTTKNQKKDTSGPDILMEEVESAIKQLKPGKVAGLNQLRAEIIK